MKRCLFILAFLIVAQLLKAQTPGSFYSLNFGGKSAKVGIPDDTTLNFQGEISIEAWVKPDSFKTGGTTNCIVSKHGQRGGYDLRTNVNGGAVFRFGTATGWKFIISKTKLEKGRWYHLAGTYNGDSLCIYVNGNLDKVKYDTASLGTSYGVSLRFGEYSKWGISPLPGGNFKGQIDEVRIWNKALSPQEINLWMFRKLKKQHSSWPYLVGNWRFDASDGRTAYDQSKNANDGLISGGQWKRSGAPIGDSFIVSLDTSLTFSSTSGTKIRIKHKLPSNQRLVVFWVKEPPKDTIITNGLALLDDEYFGVYSPDTTSFNYDFKIEYKSSLGADKECLLDVFEQKNIDDSEWKPGNFNFSPGQNEFNGQAANASQLILGKYFDKRKVNIRYSDTVLCVGEKALLTAYGNNKFDYQWYKDGVSLSPDTSRILRIDSAGVYYVSISRNSNCNYNSIPVLITVNPLPIVSLPRLKSICQYADSIVVKQGFPKGGKLFGSVIIKDSFIVPSLYIPNLYDVIYGFTDSNGCYSADTQSIRIQNKPNASFVKTQEICNNLDTANLVMGRPFGGTYNGLGVANNAFYLDSVNRKTGDFNVRYIFTDSVGCMDTANGKVTVLASTPVRFTNLNDTCENVDSFKIRTNPPTLDIKGLGIRNGYFNPAKSKMGNYTLICSFTNPFGCTTHDTATFKVKKVDSVIFNLADTICHNGNKQLVNAARPMSGAYLGLDSLGFFIPENHAKSGNHYISYSFTNANGCTDVDSGYFHLLDTIEPVIGRINAICENDKAFVLNDVLPKGGYYEINGIADSNFKPMQLGGGTHKIKYTILSSENCKSQVSYYRNIFPKTPIHFVDSVIEICKNADSIKLSNALPNGGFYSKVDSGNGYLNPSSFNVGSHFTSYSFNDTNSCKSIDSFLLKIQESPEVRISLDSTFCENDGSLELSGFGNPSGGKFTLSDVEIIEFSPTELGQGRYQLDYTYATANGCADSTSKEILVYGAPEKPSLTKTDTTIISSSSINNQWYDLEGKLFGDTFQVFAPNKSGNYYTVVSNRNCSAYSDTVNFIHLFTQSMFSAEFKVYPNPASHAIYIEHKLNESIDVSIFDLSGKLITKKEISSSTQIIHLPKELENGTYLLLLKTDENSIIKQLIISN